MHALSGIRTHDPSVRAGEDISCPRLLGHCNRRGDRITLHISHCLINLFSILSMNHVSAVHCHKILLTKVVYSKFSKLWQQRFLYCFCAKKLSIQISTYDVQPEPLAKEAWSSPYCEGVTDLVSEKLARHGRIHSETEATASAASLSVQWLTTCNMQYCRV
jgi:hypothetical protein